MFDHDLDSSVYIDGRDCKASRGSKFSFMISTSSRVDSFIDLDELGLNLDKSLDVSYDNTGDVTGDSVLLNEELFHAVGDCFPCWINSFSNCSVVLNELDVFDSNSVMACSAMEKVNDVELLEGSRCLVVSCLDDDYVLKEDTRG